MKAALSFALAFGTLSCTYAQVVGQAGAMAKTCYARANKDGAPRPIKIGMELSVGEEVFCPLDGRLVVDLVNGEQRVYEPQWSVVGGVPAASKARSKANQPHVESASAEPPLSELRATRAEAKAAAKADAKADAKAAAAAAAAAKAETSKSK